MPLANCLFFVHIPKTAGTSLRLALEDALGKEHICYDYGVDSPHTEPDIKRLGYPTADMFRLERALAPKHYKLIGGHVPAMRYAPMIPVSRMFTFIRNPVDQLISHHAHYVRHHGFQGDLAAFIKTPMARPIATRMLGGVPLEAIGLVGVTEAYETSLGMLSDLYSLDIAVRHDNRNPANQHSSYRVPTSLKDEINKLLEPEFILWERAKVLLQARQKARQQGYTYIHGAIQALKSNVVSGFAFIAGSARPVRIGIRINGQPVKPPVFATTYRPGLRPLNVPRNACIGFDVPFPKSLKTGDTVTCFVAATGQVLDQKTYGA